ncbi:MAG TPA: alpha/beta hydrolase [Blastocatellia bacterium]|nr:alpha/beta hydrolase [Blastocatellia bacterium]
MKQYPKRLYGGGGYGWRIARVMIVLCVGPVLIIMAIEDSFIYFPAKFPEGQWAVENIPAREGEFVPKIEDCKFMTSDGMKLHGWYCAPWRKLGGNLAPVHADMVLLWFHGNAGNLSHRYDMIKMLMRIPVNVFIIDYRGYGKSEGAPSEEGLYADARAAWDYLTGGRGVPPERVIIFGKSLGGVPAIDLAGRVKAAGLIVQSSFTSAADMAAAILPIYPRFFLRTKMDSKRKIASVACPKLFIHSRADEVIPYKLGRRLFEAAPEPKQFYEVERAPHNSTYLVGGEEYLNALRNFINSCAPPAATEK